MTPRYEAFVFVPPGAEVSVPALAAALTARFASLGTPDAPAPKVELRGSTVQITFPRFTLQATLSSADHLLEEAAEIAGILEEKEVAARVALSDRRIEVHSVGDDDDMVYFNDYLTLVETLQAAIPDSIAWEPRSNHLI